jgi:Ca2+-binding RTX toxin-like protein
LDGNDSFDGAAMTDPGTQKTPDPIVIEGMAGDDEILAIAAFSCPDGGGNDDRIDLVKYQGSIAGLGYCLPEGGAGDDEIFGTDKDDYMLGGIGKDLLVGGDKGDELEGNAGADILRGDDGADVLHPGQGADKVHGGAMNDEIVVVYPRPGSKDGSDELIGGQGKDLATYFCGRCTLALDGKANDGVEFEKDNLEAEKVTIYSRSFADEIGTTYGPGNDVLRGGAGDEVLMTRRGNDRLVGGPGRDVLDGGDDDDLIRSDDGEPDIVECGPGRDSAVGDGFDDFHGCESVVVP